MKPIAGFKSEANTRGYEQLPAGPYVGVIKAVKLDGFDPDQTLILRLEVAEGPYEGYYGKRYMHESKRKDAKFPAKYKGDFRIRIPNENNKKALYPESDLKNFNDAIYRIEESNPGYHWDWNEQGLVGLNIGFSVRQGTYNGNQFTKIAKLEIVDEVRMGQVGIMEPMQPKNDIPAEPPVYEPPVTHQVGYTEVQIDDGSLPF